MTSPDSARIVVQRRLGGYRDRVRRYKVLVDGVERGALGEGEQIEVPVAPGAHTFRAAIDWTGSRTVPVEVRPGQTVRFSIEPNGGVWSQFVQIFTRSGWIKVTPDLVPR